MAPQTQTTADDDSMTVLGHTLTAGDVLTFNDSVHSDVDQRFTGEVVESEEGRLAKFETEYSATGKTLSTSLMSAAQIEATVAEGGRIRDADSNLVVRRCATPGEEDSFAETLPLQVGWAQLQWVDMKEDKSHLSKVVYVHSMTGTEITLWHVPAKRRAFMEVHNKQRGERETIAEYQGREVTEMGRDAALGQLLEDLEEYVTSDE